MCSSYLLDHLLFRTWARVCLHLCAFVLPSSNSFYLCVLFFFPTAFTCCDTHFLLFNVVSDLMNRLFTVGLHWIFPIGKVSSWWTLLPVLHRHSVDQASPHHTIDWGSGWRACKDKSAWREKWAVALLYLNYFLFLFFKYMYLCHISDFGRVKRIFFIHLLS